MVSPVRKKPRPLTEGDGDVSMIPSFLNFVTLESDAAFEEELGKALSKSVPLMLYFQNNITEGSGAESTGWLFDNNDLLNLYEKTNVHIVHVNLKMTTTMCQTLS